ncbi:helix-turn-helix transcriptional regulator [Listeria monocytogenes]
MTINNSFTEYIKQQFTAELYSAANHFVEHELSEVELSYYPGVKFTTFSLSDLLVRKVYVQDRPGLLLRFDVLVEAVLTVLDDGYDDTAYQWLRIACEGPLHAGLTSLHVLRCDFYDNQKSHFTHTLSDQLIPVLSTVQLEELATDFLQRYAPQALNTPVALDPKALAECMGLKVVRQPITPNGTIFGQTFFADDPNGHTAGTIVIEEQLAVITSQAVVNMTIIHECIHWLLHRKVFELAHFYQEQLHSLITLPETTKKAPLEQANSDQGLMWMEWQARALAPKILMPQKMVHQYMATVFPAGITPTLKEQLPARIDQVIETMAHTFGVSRLSAKIRLVELGYEVAMGAFNFIENRYIPTHCWQLGQIKSQQTFCIDPVSAQREIERNPALQEKLLYGQYVYVEAHFILNTPKYVTQDQQGNLCLTPYARAFIDECALLFEMKIPLKPPTIPQEWLLELVLNREQQAPFELEISWNKGYQHATPAKQAAYLQEILTENTRMYQKLTNDVSDCLQQVLKWRGLTRKELAEKIPMEERQIRRIFSGESSGSLPTLVAICLVLYLPSIISFHIIERSTVSFNFNDPAHKWYYFVLTSCAGKSLEEVRRLLREKQIPL